jgi:predicted ATPase
LAWLHKLADTPERAQQELRLQITLGASLAAIKGFAAPEVKSSYNRAPELCRQVEQTPEFFLVLEGLYLFYCTRGELETARGLAGQLLRLAQRLQDSTLFLRAHTALGTALLFLGEFTLVRAHAEQRITLYDPRQHSFQTSLSWGPDPGPLCLSRAAQALWFLGWPAQALQRSQEALTLARKLVHPWNLVWALEYAALLRHLLREGQSTQEQTETVLALAHEQGFVPAVADATILRGWALAEQGQGEEGITQIHRGVATWQAMGAEVGRTYFLGLLVEACGKVGQIEEGLRALDEALGLVHKNGERICEAELYRLKGTLTLQSQVPGLKSQETSRVGIAHHNVMVAVAGTVGEAHPTGEEDAEAYLLKALDIARAQQAKSWELRAAISLARLWQQQGKREEARQMLAEIYGWFTEGFDTVDLQEAKALLESLT